jgi:hypothetical protein
MHIHYKKKGKQWWSISGSWYRTAAASTFTGGYAGSSNRRGLYFCFFTFLFFNKRLKSFVPLSSFTLPHASLPSPCDSSICPFRNCSGVKSLILPNEILVKTTHHRAPPSAVALGSYVFGSASLFPSFCVPTLYGYLLQVRFVTTLSLSLCLFQNFGFI